MKGICLPEYQIKAALDGRLKQFTKPLKMQPFFSKNVWVHMSGMSFCDAGTMTEYLQTCDWLFQCKIDKKYYVKETYVYTTSKENCVYKIDCKDKRGDFWKSIADDSKCVFWCSPITMPAWAARIFVTSTDIMVRRVQELDEGDFIFEGCPSEYLLGSNWFVPVWDKQHPKTPWDSNPWVATYKIDVEVSR
jgi:hypothetical protein